MLNTNFNSWMGYFTGLLDEKTRIRYKTKHKGGGNSINGMFKVLLLFVLAIILWSFFNMGGNGDKVGPTCYSGPDTVEPDEEYYL